MSDAVRKDYEERTARIVAARRAVSKANDNALWRALAELRRDGETVTVTAVAERAGVGRSMLYRPGHEGVLAAIQAQGQPPALCPHCGQDTAPGVSGTGVSRPEDDGHGTA